MLRHVKAHGTVPSLAGRWLNSYSEQQAPTLRKREPSRVGDLQKEIFSCWNGFCNNLSIAKPKTTES